MKRLVYVLTVGMVIALAGGVRATQILFTDFEGFKTGASIENQNGWSSDNPGWDEEIVNASGNTVWRVSNAVASGTFGDMPFAPRLGGIPTNTVTNPTNDSPGAFAGESSTGTSLDRFHSMFSFRSATGGPQPGARITVSADNGEGGRQSFISLEDTGSGINVGTFDVNTGGNFIGTLGCVLGVDVPCPAIVIASNLSYKKWHTTSVEIRFKDGPSNDRVKYFVNGAHVHTGPSWEQFYRTFQAGLHPLGVPVQTLLFRISGTPCPSCAGRGFYIDNVGQVVSRFGHGGDDDEDHDDCDRDGKNDDLDDDDDNDGHKDAFDDDDDDDGIEDRFDGKGTREEQSSFVSDLGSGEEDRYAMTGDLNTVSLAAVLSDGQAMVLDILNPTGAVIASTLPAVGPAVVTVPVAAAGAYAVRVRNLGLTNSASRVTLIRSVRR